MPEILLVDQIDHQPHLLHAVTEMLHREQAAGTITADRADPDGTERGALAGPPGAPFGIATFFPVDDARIWLDLLIVRPGCRGQGLGRRLVETVVTAAHHLGHDRVELGTMTGNVPMQRLAGSLGLAPIGLLYAMPARAEAHGLADIRAAQQRLHLMVSEQHSQDHALRLRLRRAKKAGQRAAPSIIEEAR